MTNAKYKKSVFITKKMINADGVEDKHRLNRLSVFI